VAHVIQQRTQYLGFDDEGNHRFTADYLDAIRFDNPVEAHQAGQLYIDMGASIVHVDNWDGHYETYLDYEIQIYLDRDGESWRYRIGPDYGSSPFTLNYTSHEDAMMAAKQAVNRRPRLV
jgi:hypothetical protein